MSDKNDPNTFQGIMGSTCFMTIFLYMFLQEREKLLETVAPQIASAMMTRNSTSFLFISIALLSVIIKTFVVCCVAYIVLVLLRMSATLAFIPAVSKFRLKPQLFLTDGFKPTRFIDIVMPSPESFKFRELIDDREIENTGTADFQGFYIWIPKYFYGIILGVIACIILNMSYGFIFDFVFKDKNKSIKKKSTKAPVSEGRTYSGNLIIARLHVNLVYILNIIVFMSVCVAFAFHKYFSG